MNTRSLDGMVTYTSTRSYDVVTSVTVDIEMDDGRSRAVTSAVLSQAGDDNPWLGAVPGELPSLQEAGK